MTFFEPLYTTESFLMFCYSLLTYRNITQCGILCATLETLKPSPVLVCMKFQISKFSNIKVNLCYKLNNRFGFYLRLSRHKYFKFHQQNLFLLDINLYPQLFQTTNLSVTTQTQTRYSKHLQNSNFSDVQVHETSPFEILTLDNFIFSSLTFSNSLIEF